MLKIFDSTLRDGSHAVKQKLTEEFIEGYCKKADNIGEAAIFVGHGNGLGASSIQMGVSDLGEMEMLKIARKNLHNTKLGGFVTVGFGTIKECIIPAIDIGVDLFAIAAHSTEADTLKKHIEFLVKENIPVYGVLMNYHMATKKQLIDAAKKIEQYGARGLILMDSAGASLPHMVKEVYTALAEHSSLELGFHGHNNLGMAVSNTYEAINAGATIIDGTIQGFGSGAGNCQLESIVAFLKKSNIEVDVNLQAMFTTGEYLRNTMQYMQGIDPICIMSGMSGVVSTFKTKVIYFSEKYDVNPYEVFKRLGKRKAIAGQDDLIYEIVCEIKEEKK